MPKYSSNDSFSRHCNGAMMKMSVRNSVFFKLIVILWKASIWRVRFKMIRREWIHRGLSYLCQLQTQRTRGCGRCRSKKPKLRHVKRRLLNVLDCNFRFRSEMRAYFEYAPPNVRNNDRKNAPSEQQWKKWLVRPELAVRSACAYVAWTELRKFPSLSVDIFDCVIVSVFNLKNSRCFAIASPRRLACCHFRQRIASCRPVLARLRF